jgi:hypothetical protein
MWVGDFQRPFHSQLSCDCFVAIASVYMEAASAQENPALLSHRLTLQVGGLIMTPKAAATDEMSLIA